MRRKRQVAGRLIVLVSKVDETEVKLEEKPLTEGRITDAARGELVSIELFSSYQGTSWGAGL